MKKQFYYINLIASVLFGAFTLLCFVSTLYLLLMEEFQLLVVMSIFGVGFYATSVRFASECKI